MHGMQVVEQSGLRERKKQATRGALTSAARHLIGDHGLDAVTTEMICTEAGVSVRTFFNYFDSKESAALGEAAPVGTPQSQAEFVAGGPSGALLPDLLGLLLPVEMTIDARRDDLLELLRLLQDEPRLLAAQLTRISELEDEVAQLVTRRRGLPPDDTRGATAAAVAFALVRRACFDWLAHDGRDAADCVVAVQDEAAELFRQL